MTENAPRESAKIYDFPTGGRAGMLKGRERSLTPFELAAQRAPQVATTGWYHEAAMAEELVAKRPC